MKSPAISVEALLVLDAIVEQGSFAAAAEKLNKVPSALSYIVQKLEEQLSVTLFQREGRRSVLTPAGKYLLNEGRHVLIAINKISEQTKTIANGWEPTIRIAVDSIIDIDMVMPIFNTFLETHGNIELDIKEEVLNGTWEALIHDDVDIAIGAAAPIPTHKGIRAIPLCELDVVFCVNAMHELAQNNNILSQTQLQNYRTVVVHDSAKRIIPKTTGVIEQSEHLYVSTIDQKIKVILAGLGAGFLPINRVQSLLDAKQLIAINLAEPQPSNQLYIAWKVVNKGKGLNSLLSILSDYFDNELRV